MSCIKTPGSTCVIKGLHAWHSRSEDRHNSAHHMGITEDQLSVNMFPCSFFFPPPYIHLCFFQPAKSAVRWYRTFCPAISTTFTNTAGIQSNHIFYLTFNTIHRMWYKTCFYWLKTIIKTVGVLVIWRVLNEVSIYSILASNNHVFASYYIL